MWLRSTLPLLRSQRSSDVGALRRRLKQLRSSNRRAHTVLRERRRMEEAGGSSSATSEQRLRLLPVNEALESSIAFALSENRDARAELELTRHLLNSSLLSMASPVDVFDPYDVKPQTFALDNYLALPVFTSLKYLRAFCSKFGYATRDPRGVLWADGKGDGEGSTAVHLLPAGLTDHDMWRASAYNPASPTPQECGNATDIGEKDVEMKESSTISPTDEMDAESLFAELNGEESTPSHKRKRPRRRKTPNRRRRVHPSPSSSEPSSSRTSTSADRRVLEEEAKRRFWSRVMTVPQFGVTQATPLPMFGPFTRAFFVGYFADINTLLHNASIIPKKVDIILNPASPLEFVLAREVTDCVLQREPLLFKAYKKVERELQREFATFFLSACPEVRRARSACIPGPLNFDAATAAMKAAHTGVSSNSRNPLHTYRQRTRMLREAEYSLGQTYTLVVILESDDLSSTFVRIQEAKRQCALMGHRDLDVLPLEAAAPHVVEASSVFYDRSAEQQHTQNLSHDDSATTVRRSVNGHSLGIFTQRGSSVTVNVAQPAESFYHDPTNAYTEAHAVFTEELNSRRR